MDNKTHEHSDAAEGRWFKCGKCGKEFNFAGSTTFGFIYRQLEDHICFPTALKISSPLARTVVHTVLVLIIAGVCCVAANAQQAERPFVSSAAQHAREALGVTPLQSSALPSQSPTQNGGLSGKSSAGSRARFRLDWGDLAMAIGGAFDLASGPGLPEKNPALRNSAGGLSVSKELSFKLGIWGAKKTIQAFYPDHPKATMWFGVGIGLAWVGAGAYNTHLKGRR